jgi:hypothetical protein
VELSDCDGGGKPIGLRAAEAVRSSSSCWGELLNNLYSSLPIAFVLIVGSDII